MSPCRPKLILTVFGVHRMVLLLLNARIIVTALDNYRGLFLRRALLYRRPHPLAYKVDYDLLHHPNFTFLLVPYKMNSLPSFVELMAALGLERSASASQSPRSTTTSPRPESVHPSSPTRSKSSPSLRESASRHRVTRYSPYSPSIVSLCHLVLFFAHSVP